MDFHSRHHNELAAQHLPLLLIIGQLAAYAAILAILVPAESPIRNRFRADKLKTTQQRVAFRHLKFFPHDGQVHQLFIGTKGFRHKHPVLGASAWRACGALLKPRTDYLFIEGSSLAYSPPIKALGAVANVPRGSASHSSASRFTDSYFLV